MRHHNLIRGIRLFTIVVVIISISLTIINLFINPIREGFGLIPSLLDPRFLFNLWRNVMIGISVLGVMDVGMMLLNNPDKLRNLGERKKRHP